MQIGIVGLQLTGKSTLFKTLAGDESATERSMVKVPDKRLDHLTELFNPKKQINATLEVMDIPGIQVGPDGKARITSDFLNAVKNNDALFHVVREFKNDAVPPPEGGINIKRDIEFLESEFLFADMALIENRIEKLKKEVMKSRNENVKKELPLFEKMQAHLEGESPLREMKLDDNERKLISGYQFLTIKPMIIGINFGEDSKDSAEQIVAEIEQEFSQANLNVVPIFAQFELELAQLDEEEAEMFKEDFGIKDSALDRILRSLYKELGLQSFFTVGEDECRAWTIRVGNTAQEAAGVIHTDFYNKFIRAEVTHYDDYIEHGSFAKCKDAGVWRLEGKEYIVKDGDILNIRHG